LPLLIATITTTDPSAPVDPTLASLLLIVVVAVVSVLVLVDAAVIYPNPPPLAFPCSAPATSLPLASPSS